MATNRVTRPIPRAEIGKWIRLNGTAMPGTILSTAVLCLLATGSIGSGMSTGLLVWLGLLGLARITRRLSPPRSTHPAVALTARTDPFVLPLAAAALIAFSMGRSGGLAFPASLLLLLWAGATLGGRTLGVVVVFALLAEVLRFVGRGAWSGELPLLATHLGFLTAFGLAAPTLVRGQMSDARKRAELEAKRLAEETRQHAQALGVDDPARNVVELSVEERVTQLRSTLGTMLQLVRRAGEAHSAVLMTCEPGSDTLHLVAAASPEVDILNDAPACLTRGIPAMLAKLSADGDDQPVLRLAVENRELPYYTRTPARIRNLLAIQVNTGERLQGVLFLDRTAGPAFDDAILGTARASAMTLGRMLDAERDLLAVERRSHSLDHLLEAGAELAAAFHEENMPMDSDPMDQVSQVIYAAASRLIPLRFGAVVEAGRQGQLRVVGAAGEDSEKLSGLLAPANTSLPGMVLKTPAVVPASRTWHPAHGPLLGIDAGPTLRPGEPIVVLPLSTGGDRTAAMVLVGLQPFDDTIVSSLRVLLSQAETSLAHARSLRELRARATTDALTSLDNRGTIVTRLDQSLARCGRAEQSVGVLMLDIDFFKHVNDTHGHPSGDMVLRQVARTLEESKRVNDSVGRFGGEEFLIVLENTDEAGALLVAERIRTRIEGLNFPSQAGTFRVTASMGLAVAPRHADQRDALLKKADQALYLAKDGGRNQVVCHGHRAVAGRVTAVKG